MKKTREVVATPPAGGQPRRRGAGGGRGGRGGGGGGRGGGRGGVAITKTCGPNVTGHDRSAAGVDVAGRHARRIFICDWNLWVRDVATGQERQLTTDGVKDFGYATSNAGWTTSAAPSLSWSPDGKKIATQQQDERKVGDMYLVETPVNGGHPVLRAWKYPLPGDPDVAMITPRHHRRGHRQGHAAADGAGFPPRDVRRQPRHGRVPLEPGRHAPRFRLDRSVSQVLHRQARRHRPPAKCGRCSPRRRRRTCRRACSGRSSGTPTKCCGTRSATAPRRCISTISRPAQLKNKITERRRPDHAASPGSIAPTRTMWFDAVGKEKGQDPYFTHLYKVGLDGKNYVSLTPDNGTHTDADLARRQVHHRHVLAARCRAGDDAARRQRPAR